MKQVHISNLSDLSWLEELLPEGTIVNIREGDFSAGNFDTAQIVLPKGEMLSYSNSGNAKQMLFGTVEIVYSGPVDPDFEYAERERKEAAFKAAYPNGFDRLSDEIEAMKQYGLYCGTCGHGNGCEHGVPASRH